MFPCNDFFNLLLIRWPRLEIENVLLEPVTGSHDRLSTLPPTPTPPSKTISKRDARCWSASTGCMLEIIALLPLAILEKSAVEMIVQSFA
jgi:hypothetical protein